MKKVKVSAEACIGCGACVAIDPDHFEFDDNGLSHAINQENLETEELQNAIESCPTSAIAIHEVSEVECEENCDCTECNCRENNCNCDDNCNCGCNCEEECDIDCDCGCGCNDECNCESECNCNCTECSTHQE